MIIMTGVCCAALTVHEWFLLVLITLCITIVLYGIVHVVVYGVPYKGEVLALKCMVSEWVRSLWYRKAHEREMIEMLELSGIPIEDYREEHSLLGKCRRKVIEFYRYVGIGVVIVLVKLGICRK